MTQDGRPLAGARVSFGDGDSTTTDADGAWRLDVPEGRVDPLVVVRNGEVLWDGLAHADGVTRVDVTLPDAMRRRRIERPLSGSTASPTPVPWERAFADAIERGVSGGRVRVAGRSVASDLRVTLRPAPMGEFEPGVELFLKPDGGSWTARGLPAGRWILAVEAAPRVACEVVVADGLETTVDLATLDLPPSASIVAVSPATGVAIFSTSRPPPGERRLTRTAVSVARAERLVMEMLPPGRGVLELLSAGAAHRWAFDLRPHERVVLEAPPPCVPLKVGVDPNCEAARHLRTSGLDPRTPQLETAIDATGRAAALDVDPVVVDVGRACAVVAGDDRRFPGFTLHPPQGRPARSIGTPPEIGRWWRAFFLVRVDGRPWTVAEHRAFGEGDPHAIDVEAAAPGDLAVFVGDRGIAAGVLVAASDSPNASLELGRLTRHEAPAHSALERSVAVVDIDGRAWPFAGRLAAWPTAFGPCVVWSRGPVTVETRDAVGAVVATHVVGR
ncbi:MAG TPA: carboxypeptidase-like regulatory domain-containing protein [Planctomycetota bacterium]|nr:carboxypeptidase-like regulatory domain-containing protein [Planctomycetota bacterium]